MSDYAKLVHQWFAAEMVEMYRRDPPDPAPGGLLLGGAAWGKYAGRFVHLALRTIKAPLNFHALKGRSRVVLFTSPESFDDLWKAARELTAAGLKTQIMLIPPALLPREGMDKDDWMPLLGGCQNYLVQMAARYGLGFHALFPDHLYSAEYFPNLFRLVGDGHSAIAQTTISSDFVACAKELDRWALRDMLCIPARDLGDLGWRHLHPQSAGNVMNRGVEVLGYPSSHCVIWQAHDRVSVHCCHTNAAYLSPGLCAKAPVGLFSPMDCNLPWIMTEGFYTPTADDGMTFIELSDADKPGIDTRHDIEMFSAICWYHTRFRDDFLPWFRAGSEVPIAPQAEFLEMADIRRRHAALIEDVKAHKETVRGRIRFKEAA